MSSDGNVHHKECVSITIWCFEITAYSMHLVVTNILALTKAYMV